MRPRKGTEESGGTTRGTKRAIRRPRRRKNMEHITMRFPEGLIRAIERVAGQRGMDFSTFSRNVLGHYVGYDPLRDEPEDSEESTDVAPH